LRGIDLELPTEAQWEYAARAGTSTPWSFGSDPETLDEYANIADQSLREVSPMVGWTYSDIVDGGIIHVLVGSYRPNKFGLHDVHGNVLELCREGRKVAYLNTSDSDSSRHELGTGLLVDSQVGDSASSGVARGGSWVNPDYMTTSAHRYAIDAQRPDAAIGIRPVRSIH
jgi:formylglycine-generating enzyme required for sulfatase activity